MIISDTNTAQKLFDQNDEYNILSLITACNFLVGPNVSALILVVKHISTSVDLSRLNYIKASIAIICRQCSLDCIKNVPKTIKIEMWH